MAFLYQWVAPNGIPVVVAKVRPPANATGARIVVGVYRSSVPQVNGRGQPSDGWYVIDAPVTDDNGNPLSLANAQSLAQLDGKRADGDVFYYASGAPVPGDGQQKTSSGTYADAIFHQGWYSRQLAQIPPQDLAAYTWGLQKLASMSSTLPSAVSGTPTAPTLSSSVNPGTTLQTAVTPLPASPSRLPLYIGLAVAAVAGYLLLGGSSSASASATAAS